MDRNGGAGLVEIEVVIQNGRVGLDIGLGWVDEQEVRLEGRFEELAVGAKMLKQVWKYVSAKSDPVVLEASSHRLLPKLARWGTIVTVACFGTRRRGSGGWKALAQMQD